MNKYFLLALLCFSTTSTAQVLGTPKKISETSFCIKYKCQYVKSENTADGVDWTYYINPQVNFDIYREVVRNSTFATSVTIRFVGGSPKNNDYLLISDLYKTVLGRSVSTSELSKCSRALKSEYVLYDPLNGSDIRYHVTCSRIDSTEFRIDFTPYGY